MANRAQQSVSLRRVFNDYPKTNIIKIVVSSCFAATGVRPEQVGENLLNGNTGGTLYRIEGR
nr:MAG TPA: hypothetical protein [Caudoviricetes sp.]